MPLPELPATRAAPPITLPRFLRSIWLNIIVVSLPGGLCRCRFLEHLVCQRAAPLVWRSSPIFRVYVSRQATVIASDAQAATSPAATTVNVLVRIFGADLRTDAAPLGAS